MAVFAANLRALRGRPAEVTILDDHGFRVSEVEEDLRAGALAHAEQEQARADVNATGSDPGCPVDGT